MLVLRCGLCLRRLRLRSWRRVLVGVRIGLSRWWLVCGRRWFRCLLRRVGCGLLISCRGLRRFTTWRQRCGCGVWLMLMRWVRRWLMWWVGMRACGRWWWGLRGYLGRWLFRLSGLILVGVLLMRPGGRKTGWVRLSMLRRVTRLIWGRRFRCGRGFCVLVVMSMCWWLWCTTLLLMVGR